MISTHVTKFILTHRQHVLHIRFCDWLQKYLNVTECYWIILASSSIFWSSSVVVNHLCFLFGIQCLDLVCAPASVLDKLLFLFAPYYFHHFHHKEECRCHFLHNEQCPLAVTFSCPLMPWNVRSSGSHCLQWILFSCLWNWHRCV